MKTYHQRHLVKVPAVLLLLFASLPIAAQTRYVVVDLGAVGGLALSTTAIAINRAGQVAGNSTGALNAYYRAFRTSPNKPINPVTDIIPAFASGTYSQVYFNAINNSGQVAGFADEASGAAHAFRFDADNIMRDLGSLGIYLNEAVCCGVNDSAQVTGNLVVSYSPAPPDPCSKSSIEPAFRTARFGTIEPDDYLGSLLGRCGNAQGIAINNVGHVVGYSSTSTAAHAMLVTGTVMQDLGTLGGSATSTAYSINNFDQIAGVSTYISTSTKPNFHAFYTTPTGPMRDLGALPSGNASYPYGANSYAYGINDAGQIVGQSDTAGETLHGFLYVHDSMYDLNNLIASSSGWTIINAAGINDKGQIAGNALLNGTLHPVRMDPVDVAASILLSELSSCTGAEADAHSRLESALDAIEKGNAKSAANKLEAFVDSIQASIRKGKVEAASGSTLIAEADAIIAALSGT